MSTADSASGTPYAAAAEGSGQRTCAWIEHALTLLSLMLTHKKTIAKILWGIVLASMAAIFLWLELAGFLVDKANLYEVQTRGEMGKYLQLWQGRLLWIPAALPWVLAALLGTGAITLTIHIVQQILTCGRDEKTFRALYVTHQTLARDHALKSWNRTIMVGIMGAFAFAMTAIGKLDTSVLLLDPVNLGLTAFGFWAIGLKNVVTLSNIATGNEDPYKPSRVEMSGYAALCALILLASTFSINTWENDKETSFIIAAFGAMFLTTSAALCRYLWVRQSDGGNANFPGPCELVRHYFFYQICCTSMGFVAWQTSAPFIASLRAAERALDKDPSLDFDGLLERSQLYYMLFFVLLSTIPVAMMLTYTCTRTIDGPVLNNLTSAICKYQTIPATLFGTAYGIWTMSNGPGAAVVAVSIFTALQVGPMMWKTTEFLVRSVSISFTNPARDLAWSLRMICYVEFAITFSMLVFITANQTWPTLINGYYAEDSDTAAEKVDEWFLDYSSWVPFVIGFGMALVIMVAEFASEQCLKHFDTTLTIRLMDVELLSTKWKTALVLATIINLVITHEAENKTLAIDATSVVTIFVFVIGHIFKKTVDVQSAPRHSMSHIVPKRKEEYFALKSKTEEELKQKLQKIVRVLRKLFGRANTTTPVDTEMTQVHSAPESENDAVV